MQCIITMCCGPKVKEHKRVRAKKNSLFVWLVADDWCWFVLREKYCWLVAGG
jgi:hypothetical protein